MQWRYIWDGGEVTDSDVCGDTHTGKDRISKSVHLIESVFFLFHLCVSAVLVNFPFMMLLLMERLPVEVEKSGESRKWTASCLAL